MLNMLKKKKKKAIIKPLLKAGQVKTILKTSSNFIQPCGGKLHLHPPFSINECTVLKN